MTFHISGLDSAEFAHLSKLSDAELAERGIAIEREGGPCRVSLTEAPEDAELLLLNYCHLDTKSPFRSQGPIYIRRDVATACLAPNEIPGSLKTRLLSFRAYDRSDMMIDAKVAEGSRTDETLRALFDDESVAFIHVHYALRGCYACRVDRA